MPAIQLLNDGNDHLRVLSCMYFPSDRAKRAQLCTLDESPEREGQLPLNDFADHKGRLNLSEIGWRASMAGEVLFRTAALCQGKLPEPSVRKAIFSIWQHALALRSNGEEILDGKPFNRIAINERSYWNHWEEFKPLSYLWAAHRVLEEAVPFFDIPDALADDALLQQFLGWSQFFLQFGCDKESRNNKVGSLLDSTIMWSVMPTPQQIEPDLQSALSNFIDELKDYKAH